MTTSEPVTDMGAEDRVSLGIGRVARAHVLLDDSLRRVHQALASPGLGVYLHSEITSTDRLANECKLMIRKAAVGPTVAAAAQGALDAAKAANERRNRVVHDMWLRDVDASEDQPPRWSAFRVYRGELNITAREDDQARDLAYLDAALTLMTRTRIRVMGVHWALWEVLPFFQGAHGESPSSLPDWLAVMNDRFELTQDGGFRVVE
jgi:hypothetical protein